MIFLYWLVGLSPHVRGNHVHAVRVVGVDRSIPARAGEPTPKPLRVQRSPVYPRTCGGTCPALCCLVCLPGLSPHVRGNHFNPPLAAAYLRSIPARAGEPALMQRLINLEWVYPRTCGGTVGASGSGAAVPGLSPHVRGNPPRSLSGSSVNRSIPARAGEPPSAPSSARERPVYPRTCGGTSTAPRSRS